MQTPDTNPSKPTNQNEIKWSKFQSIGLWITGILTLLTTISFLGFVAYYLNLFGNQLVDWGVTGQVGDFFGGVIGSLIAAFGSILLYMSFSEQRKSQLEQAKQFKISLTEQQHSNQAQNEQFLKSQIESRFTSLLSLHQKNLENIKIKAEEQIQEREAIEHILDELEICYEEIQFTCENKSLEGIFQPAFLEECNKLLINRPKLDLKKLAIIDIAYTIVFYGITAQGLGVIIKQLEKYYKRELIFTQASILLLKNEDVDIEIWKKIFFDRETFEITKSFMDSNINDKPISEAVKDAEIFPQLEEWLKQVDIQYYNGYYNLVGHYFRQLFQTVKYIDNQSILSYEEKYDYIKTLRSQLSVTEQNFLAVNSLSFMGREWELNHDDGSDEISSQAKFYFTKYNLIKNIPNPELDKFGLNILEFYPDIHFEFENEPENRNKLLKAFKTKISNN